MRSEVRTTFRTIPASVAQWIEQRFPKPQVVGPIPTGGAPSILCECCQVRSCVFGDFRAHNWNHFCRMHRAKHVATTC